MRRFLLSALLLSLAAGCSGVKLGPHRIDVQQGNALDQENVARLKPGLNRAQVRFLLGTPLLVDPFRTDRWDYVYVFYKAGKLAEQKHVALFFDGDTLTRIEGDLPAGESTAPARASAPGPAAQSMAEPGSAAPESGPRAQATAQPAPVAAPKPEAAAAGALVPGADSRAQPAVGSERRAAIAETSVVPPLPSPKGVPDYVDPRPPAEVSLQPETDAARINPERVPPFPEPRPAAARSDAPVLEALNAWADAWARRDDDAYFAAYDASFVPQGGGGRAAWEKRRRLLLGVARNIDLKIDSPSVDRAADGTATVTFNQFYRSDSYRDAVVKQLRMTEHDGRWLIVEEKVLSVLHGVKP